MQLSYNVSQVVYYYFHSYHNSTSSLPCWLKKCVNFELSFTWSKMRTIAWETVYQIALRNCSKEVERKVSIYVILVKTEYTKSNILFFFFLKVSASPEEQPSLWSAFLDMKRCKNWAHKIISWKYITSKRTVLLVFLRVESQQLQ